MKTTLNKPLSFIRLAINFYIEAILRMSVILINTFMISSIDALLMAATSAANMIFMLCSTIFSLTSSGLGVLIAQSLGAKKVQLARISFANAFSINALFGALICLLVSLFAKEFLALLNTPNSTLFNALTYLHFMSFVIFIDAISYVLSASLRAYGCAFSISICVLFMNLLSIILNACFLYGLFGFEQLGLLGVGLSNLLARILALLGYLFIYFFIIKERLRFLYFFKLKAKVIKKIFQIGGFNAASKAFSAIEYLCIFSLIAKLGSQSLALQTMYYQICFFIFAPATAISGANAIICAHFKGAKKDLDIIISTAKCYKLAFLASLISVLIIFLAKAYIFKALSFSDCMSQIAFNLMLISLFMEPIRALNLCFNAVFNACADVRFNFILGLISNYLIGLSLAYLLAPFFGLVGVWLAFAADESFSALNNFLRFKSRKFLAHKLI